MNIVAVTLFSFLHAKWMHSFIHLKPFYFNWFVRNSEKKKIPLAKVVGHKWDFNKHFKKWLHWNSFTRMLQVMETLIYYRDLNTLYQELYKVRQDPLLRSREYEKEYSSWIILILSFLPKMFIISASFLWDLLKCLMKFYKSWKVNKVLNNMCFS